MRLLTILLLIILLLTLTCYGSSVQAGQPLYPVQQLSPQLQVQQLAPKLWLHRTELKLSNGRSFTSNGLVLQTDAGIWLLDTAWGYYPTVDLLHWIDVVLKQPVVQAIATHSHDDRIGGAAALAQRGVPVQVTQQTMEMSAKTLQPWLQVSAQLAVGERLNQGPVEWFYPGPAHTQDNIVLYLPQYQLLFGGCAVKAPKFPGLGNIADADLQEWPQSLTRIQQAFPELKVLVPGHGDIGDSQLLDYSLQLLKKHP